MVNSFLPLFFLGIFGNLYCVHFLLFVICFSAKDFCPACFRHGAEPDHPMATRKQGIEPPPLTHTKKVANFK